MDFDAGILCRADGDWQRQPLEQRKLDMHVEALGLESGEAAGRRAAIAASLCPPIAPLEVPMRVALYAPYSIRRESYRSILDSNDSIGTKDRADHRALHYHLIDRYLFSAASSRGCKGWNVVVT